MSIAVIITFLGNCVFLRQYPCFVCKPYLFRLNPLNFGNLVAHSTQRPHRRSRPNPYKIIKTEGGKWQPSGFWAGDLLGQSADKSHPQIAEELLPLPAFAPTGFSIYAPKRCFGRPLLRRVSTSLKKRTSKNGTARNPEASR